MTRFNLESLEAIANLIAGFHVEVRWTPDISIPRSNCTHTDFTVAGFARGKEKKSVRRKGTIGWSELMEDGGIDYP